MNYRGRCEGFITPSIINCVPKCFLTLPLKFLNPISELLNTLQNILIELSCSTQASLHLPSLIFLQICDWLVAPPVGCVIFTSRWHCWASVVFVEVIDELCSLEFALWTNFVEVDRHQHVFYGSVMSRRMGGSRKEFHGARGKPEIEENTRTKVVPKITPHHRHFILSQLVKWHLSVHKSYLNHYMCILCIVFILQSSRCARICNVLCHFQKFPTVWCWHLIFG